MSGPDRYANWRKRLAGEKVPTFLQPQLDDCGYYRKAITKPELGANGKTNGRKIVTGYIPVAYFIDPFLPDVLRGIIGDRDMRDDEVAGEELWSYCCRNPISYETYQAVAENGEAWPDAHKWTVPLHEQVGTGFDSGATGHELQGRRVSDNAEPKPPAEMTLEDHKAAIEAAVKLAKETKVTSDEEANVAAGTINRLAELRLAADKAGRAIYEPMYAKYKAVQSAWAPMVATADLAEKGLKQTVLRYREIVRRRAEEARLALEESRRLEEEANARAADRAIARGEPEPQPAVTVGEALPEANTAPPPVVPTHGSRKLKEVERWHFDGVTDWDAVYNHFKDNSEVKVLLTMLATSAVKAGHDVPGTKKHWGLI